MATTRDPIGIDTYKGLAVPLYGESVIRQQNSSNAILTLMHSTGNTTGPFLLGMDYQSDDASSLLTDRAVFQIDGDGGYQAVSGTTIAFELNSSGLFDGSTNIIDADGQFLSGTTAVINSSGEALVRQQTTTLTGATTVHTLTAAQAGKLIIISTQAASSVFIHLPSSGNCYAGMTYEFVTNSTAAGILHFMTTGANAGGEIHTHIDSTGTIVSTGAISNVTTGTMWWKFVCVSTVGPIWGLENKMTQSNNSTVQLHTVAAATTA